MSDQRLPLVKDLFKSSVIEHTNAQTSFNALDAKAQNTSTIAGIFLAASLTLLNSSIFQKIAAIGNFSLIILIIITVLLTLSTVFCILAMRIRDILTIEMQNAKDEIDTILKQPDEELDVRYEKFLLSRAIDWITISKKLRNKNDAKARFIRWGQNSLGAAIISVAVLMLYILFNGMNTAK